MDERILCNCLYFTSARLSRILTKMAEEEFKSTGLFPSQALALKIINIHQGISQNYLSSELDIRPSTTSRFIDKLESKGLAKRKVKGKVTYIHSTQKGLDLQEEIDISWKNLYHRYSKILGYDEGHKLTEKLNQTSKQLEKHFQE